MKILLTGGSGFIGKNIQESYLNEKYQIIAPSRSVLDCSDDQSVERFLSRNSFDVVIHAAAKAGHRNAVDPNGILYTNSRMTMNLLKYRDSWGTLLNMGSGAIYDMRHYQPKMKEEYFGTFIPSDEHGYNKYICGLLYPHYKNVIDFRIFGIYGKYEDYAIRFISNAICKTLFDLPITLRQNRKFDYLFINDLMPILDYFIMNKVNHAAYNITPDHSVELLEVAKMVKQTARKNIDIVITNTGMGSEYSGDNSRLRGEMKQLTFTPLNESISLLHDWYRNNMTSLDIKKLMVDK